MVLENLRVKHKAFGIGNIVEAQGKYIKVKFDTTEKVFVYPDIFERFLTLEDGTVSEDILTDLNAVNDAKKKIMEKKKEENLRAMTRGIVIPGKENVNGDSDEEEGRMKNSEQEEV